VLDHPLPERGAGAKEEYPKPVEREAAAAGDSIRVFHGFRLGKNVFGTGSLNIQGGKAQPFQTGCSRPRRNAAIRG